MTIAKCNTDRELFLKRDSCFAFTLRLSTMNQKILNRKDAEQAYFYSSQKKPSGFKTLRGKGHRMGEPIGRETNGKNDIGIVLKLYQLT